MAENHRNCGDGNTQITAAEEVTVLMMTEEKLPEALNSGAGEEEVQASGNENEFSKTKTREEGELSSFDDHEIDATGSASQYACGGDTPVMESVQTSPVNENIHNAQAEQCDPAIKSAPMVGAASGAAQHEENVKISEKNREPFVPFVIRFSDDETGSDSDDSKHTNPKTEVDKEGADRNIKQPIPSILGSTKFQQNMTKNARPIRREVRHSRPPVSKLMKNKGSTQRNSSQKSSFRNINNIRGQAVQNHIPVQKKTLNPDSTIQELQDLRNLIAQRENEIKLKASQQTKNAARDSHGNGKLRSSDNHVDRVRKASVYDLRNELGESSNKRLKTGEFQSRELASDGDNNLHCLLPITLSGNLKEKRGTSASSYGAKEVISVTANSNQGAKNAKGADPVSLLRHTRGTDKGSAGAFSMKPNNMELGCTEYQSQGLQRSVQDMITSSSNLQEKHVSNLDCNMVNQLRAVAGARESSLNFLDPNQQEARLSNPSFFHDLNKVNSMANNVTDSRSLLDFEELLDKEIEEAQEHRRKCELEEKNALLAYRRAQRVLIEAHARCSQLYSKRELYSAQLRSFMMENPNLFSSQRYHDHIEAGFKSLYNISDDNVPPIPPTHHQVLTADVNKEANVPPANNERQKVLNLHVSEGNLVSDPCLEPDGSPSKGCKQPLSDGVCSSFGDLSHSSTEGGEIIESDHKSAQEHLVSEGVSEIDEGREKDIYEESEREGQDCLQLEASLRAQLFEKLKAKKLSKRGSSVDQLVEKEDENYSVGEMMETDAGNRQLCEPENDEKQWVEELDDSQEERFAGLPNQMNLQFDSSNSEHESPAEVPIQGCISIDVEQSTSGTLFFPAVKNAFNHLKIIEQHDVPQYRWTSPDVLISTSDDKIEDGRLFYRNNPGVWSFDTMDLFVGQSGSFSTDAAIDPVWPVCMYELRGKCNNDECSWQHLSDHRTSVKPESSDDSDTQFKTQSEKEHLSSAARPKKSMGDPLLAPPTYVVGLDILRLDSHFGTSTSPQGYGQCWQKIFSSFLVLSNLCPTVLQSNDPFLHGTETRIEVQSSWDRQSSYFQSRIGTPRKHDTSSAEQSLEMALLNLKDEADKCKSWVEAVVLLARGIEDDPTSTVLWIPYLLIFYSYQNSVVKDDLFQYAVKYNKESYELWLLYINSRVHLEDRVAAYESALSALCYRASKSGDNMHASQCILDIFLQMIDCLCMSGNVGKAIEQFSELFSATKKTEDHSQPTLLNIVTCLTICDKFIFWISCVYLLVYKKLPDLVVHRFECWKESYAIDWPSGCLRYDEKQQATSLLEAAVDSLELYVNHESLGNEKNLSAAHLFALNHVKCISVLEGLECGRNLLEKYTKLYPSCLELVLLSARAEYELANSSFHGFEEALRTWPDEGGVQGIWNQYAGFALQKGKLDFVKELMDRWSCSVLEAHNSEKGVLSTNEQSLKSASSSDLHAWFSTFGQVDTVFGMLNFSLYKLLNNDPTEAHIASELAFKAATVENYQLCLKELVPFWLRDSIQYEGGIYLKGIMKILHVHQAENRALLVSEPLSRDFVKKLKKPRVQQLVSKLFTPVSSDFYLMLMVLEVWDGLSMLPNVIGKSKDFVDLVEAMMEIVPSNYLLAVLACKELCKIAESTNISASLCFWAGSLLVNAFYHAVPIAPEFAWVEAAEVLHTLTDSRSIKESFLKKALTAYPFSVKLWESCLRLSETEGDRELVKEAAKEKGLEF